MAVEVLCCSVKIQVLCWNVAAEALFWNVSVEALCCNVAVETSFWGVSRSFMLEDCSNSTVQELLFFLDNGDDIDT